MGVIDRCVLNRQLTSRKLSVIWRQVQVGLGASLDDDKTTIRGGAGAHARSDAKVTR